MLRTEKHVIQKRALELFGDENTGLDPAPADVIAVINPANPIDPNERIATAVIAEAFEVPPQNEETGLETI